MIVWAGGGHAPYKQEERLVGLWQKAASKKLHSEMDFCGMALLLAESAGAVNKVLLAGILAFGDAAAMEEQGDNIYIQKQNSAPINTPLEFQPHPMRVIRQPRGQFVFTNEFLLTMASKEVLTIR
ncbi:protein RADIALIS-like 3 [Pyrus ussuriensis x Pyrus communis]|uniref:Protein RADIALIS-like 3 n=1 Tax=Pyrus ussuriensis x Pyrus communis TaxID=2448454 RepID=A0A5N5H8X0_9ROSA|nr:protein RADIALIS-like 3 [Pyrus ussuriensis x Pyrus communis]